MVDPASTIGSRVPREHYSTDIVLRQLSRLRQAMGFAGGADVETIFKELHLECGLTHQYFAARFAVSSCDRGRFWLNRWGALPETEPRGAQAVKVMCHDSVQVAKGTVLHQTKLRDHIPLLHV